MSAVFFHFGITPRWATPFGK